MSREPVLGRTSLAALYSLADKVGGPRVEAGYNLEPISSRLQHYPIISGLIGSAVDVLTCTPSLITVSDQVFLPYRIRSLVGLRGHRSGLLGPLSGRRVFRWGRTHLSGTAMSLVGGDLGVPMSNNTWL